MKYPKSEQYDKQFLLENMMGPNALKILEELTEGIKTAIEDKLGKLERYLNPETEVKVTVSAKKATQKIEVTIIPISGPIIRAEDSEENLYAAIDVVYDKLKKQIRRYKNKLQDRHQSKDESIRFQMDGGIEEDDENLDIVIERRKKFDMKPMSPEFTGPRLVSRSDGFMIKITNIR